MKAEYINPFLTAVESVLSQFGITDVAKDKVGVQDAMVIERDVCTFVGVVGAVQGNIAYAFSQATAKKLASAFVGMEITEWDELSCSVLAEYANLLTGKAAIILEGQGVAIDITTPTILIGEELYLVLSSVQTVVIVLDTSIGKIQVNVALEI